MKQTPLAKLALLGAMALLPLAGCAGNRQASLNAPGVGQPAPPPTFGQRLGSMLQALAPKPKVIPAEDPLNLSSQPKQISPELYVQTAQLFEKKGDYAKAIEQYNQAIAAKPSDLKALLGLARLYDRQEDFANATKTYQRALEAHPNNAVVLNDLGLCYARQGDVNRSLDALSKSVDADPSSKLYRNNLATILVERGLPDEALRHFIAASGESVGNYNVGVLLYKKGDTARSATYLRRAAELDPSLESARELLARIQPDASYQASATGYNGYAPAPNQPPQQAAAPSRQQAAAPAQNLQPRPRPQTQPAAPANAQHFAPIVSPQDLGVDGGQGSQNATGRLGLRPDSSGSQNVPDVRMPQLGQYAPYGEAQAPPQPDQYSGGAFLPSAFPRQLPPVE